jgi:hypothetical protein
MALTNQDYLKAIMMKLDEMPKTTSLPITCTGLTLSNCGPNGSITVNGPPPLPTPTVSMCISHPESSSQGYYSTLITLKTDVQITMPFFVFFFDGPVEDGTFEMDAHPFGCQCPRRADKLPNPERSMGFKLISVDMGRDVWFPADGPIKATIKSQKPINLVNVLSGGGEDDSKVLKVNAVFRCDD